MKDLIKRYWDIFGGTLCGIGLSYLVHWQLNQIQVIYSVIILILVCIGLFKVVKNNLDKRYYRKKIIVDKIVENQKPMKAIKMANEPTSTGEELGLALIDTMKGGKLLMKKIKNIFVWIGKYWQQIIGLIGDFVVACLVIYAYVFDKFGFILQYFPKTQAWEIGVKIAVGVIAFIFVFFTIRNQVKWVGVGSIATAQKYLNKLADAKSLELSPTAKSTVKQAINKFKEELNKVEKALSEKQKQIKGIEKELEGMKQILSLGLGNQQDYQKLVVDMQNLKASETQLKQKSEQLAQNIEKYKQVL